jgi:hypothetical protein
MRNTLLRKLLLACPLPINAIFNPKVENQIIIRRFRLEVTEPTHNLEELIFEAVPRKSTNNFLILVHSNQLTGELRSEEGAMTPICAATTSGSL